MMLTRKGAKLQPISEIPTRHHNNNPRQLSDRSPSEYVKRFKMFQHESSQFCLEPPFRLACFLAPCLTVKLHPIIDPFLSPRETSHYSAHFTPKSRSTRVTSQVA